MRAASWGFRSGPCRRAPRHRAPAAAAILEVILSPSCSMACGGGPTKMMPASAKALGEARFRRGSRSRDAPPRRPSPCQAATILSIDEYGLLAARSPISGRLGQAAPCMASRSASDQRRWCGCRAFRGADDPRQAISPRSGDEEGFEHQVTSQRDVVVLLDRHRDLLRRSVEKAPVMRRRVSAG